MHTAMKAFVVVALAAFAHAGLEEELGGETADIEYLISFKTKHVDAQGADFTAAEKKQNEEFTSSGKFTIEIIGKDGSTTGPQDLIDHPSQVLGEDDETWAAAPGMVQVAKVTAANVGEISEIKIKGANEDKWHAAWIKVNSNDFHTGDGNGIYYAPIDKEITLGEPFKASTNAQEGEPELHKCFAAFCKKAEHRYITEGDDEPPIHEHGGHFGPLGEGMPGTENDPTMTGSHFMHEFMAMAHVDDDDEDFLRTHTV